MSACISCGADEQACRCMDPGPECVLCGYAEWEPLTPWKSNYHSAPGHEFTCECGFVGDVGWHECSLLWAAASSETGGETK